MDKLSDIRELLRSSTLGDEAVVVKHMLDNLDIDADLRQSTVDMAASWVREMRASGDPGLMESFLAEYGLSTQEGVALMCMAEAYLRVPDNKTLDDLIQDKITPQNFGDHLGHSSSLMVNASTWGLMLTGSVLSDSDQRGLLPSLQKVVKRAGEPIIRVAVKRMMKMMGGQFVLGETIESAIENGEKYTKKGYRYSFDMLGEAAHTLKDADKYYLAYADAITEIVEFCDGKDVRKNPGISVKLSALYPRYETLHKADVMDSLFPSLRSLCLLAKKAGIGLNIDAEEVERLDISLEIIEALLEDGSLKGWDGLGIVVQAYSYRAPHVLDWLYALAEKYDAKLMVRLVKGAYWDREIKRSQELGLPGYPVYTRKNNSDLSYWYCAKKLLNQRDRIFPQFATHNAHTMASILKMTENETDAASTFEFQRLHGMGESLHELVRNSHDTPCRIYAPVGVHQDLLAYLVRRLLENGANASFVSQVLDNDIPPSEVTADPVKEAEVWLQQAVPGVAKPDNLFLPERINSKGFDWLDEADIEKMKSIRAPFSKKKWTAKPLVVGAKASDAKGDKIEIFNPVTNEVVGTVTEASADQLESAIKSAHKAQADWHNMDVNQRGRILDKAADLYEENAGEFFGLLSREAGKTIVDCIAELREAVDFLRYYGAQAEHIAPNKKACGVMACISPWNFPLAIFSGQLSAALAVGNAVLVKPAESTSLIAFRAVQLLHEAGVPKAVLQYLPGQGRVIGAGLSSHPDINGMIFTGSTATAKHIELSMSQTGDVRAPMIAETGGLNAMIVDSSALPEQAIIDIVASAFQSAGQRCSALRVLYLQEDIAEQTLEMLYGSMDLLRLGNPWELNVDVGPVIDEVAAKGITDYIDENKSAILKQTPISNIVEDVASTGHFVLPTVIKINGIQDLSREIFGPVLHVATFAADEIDEVVEAVNSAGFGLTFGLHTRIDSRVQQIVDKLKAGNMYINRNQIGAIVGSQPFGGEGLSGTGPKAGGPFYLKRLVQSTDSASDDSTNNNAQAEIIDNNELNKNVNTLAESQPVEFGHLVPLDPSMTDDYLTLINRCKQDLQASRKLPGPTGEDNLLSLNSRGFTLIATSNADSAFRQAFQALYCGNPVLVCNANFNEMQLKWLTDHENAIVSDKTVSAEQLGHISGLTSFVFTPNDDQLELAREYKIALAKRDGAIVRYIDEVESPYLYAQERHLCINTTAAGGNVELIANSE